MSDPFPPPGTPSVPLPPAPPGAIGVPVGGYQNPIGGYSAPPVTPPPSKRTGALALVVALFAAVVVPVTSGILAMQIGARVLIGDFLTESGEVLLATLSPVRTQVLWMEILFWTGTVLGIVALTLGIIATARRHGRGMGITAIILSALGPVGFLGLSSILFGMGTGVGHIGSI